MSKPEIHQLDTVIGELFVAGIHRHPDFFARWHSRALLALSGFESNITRRYFSTVKDQPLKRYMRYCQSVLTGLSNRLFSISGAGDDALLVVRDLVGKMEGVLLNLKKSFGDAFDAECPVTLYSHKHYRDNFDLVLAGFDDLTTGDETLRSLLVAIRNSLREHIRICLAFRPGYQELDNIQRFTRLALLFAAEPETNAHKLFNRLYTENFNLSGFAQWYQEQLLTELERLTGEQWNRRLEQEERSLLKTGIVPKDPFDKQRQPISDQLLDWLSKLRSRNASSYLRTDTLLLRLALDLSVAQLGLFLRLCYLTGCFHEHNISAVLRFFNQHFTSKKQKQISLKSLAKAFYSAELTTAASNRAWLQRMIDHINKKYFPK